MIQWFVLACGSGTVAVKNRGNGMEGNICSYTSLEQAQGSWQCRQTWIWLSQKHWQDSLPYQWEVELVALNVGKEIAAVAQLQQEQDQLSGLWQRCHRKIPFGQVCFLMVAPLSSLVSEETDKSHLEWLQCEVPPSQPRPNQHIYQIKTPVWINNICWLNAGK